MEAAVADARLATGQGSVTCVLSPGGGEGGVWTGGEAAEALDKETGSWKLRRWQQPALNAREIFLPPVKMPPCVRRCQGLLPKAALLSSPSL